MTLLDLLLTVGLLYAATEVGVWLVGWLWDLFI